MRAWFCAAGIGGLLLAAPATAATCQMRELAELPVMTDGWQVAIDGQINGAPVRMIVDTGSVATIIFPAAAKRLGLTPARYDSLKFYGIGGESQSFVVRVKEFRIGNLVGHNEDMVVTGHVAGASQGLLGAEFLLQADVEFDFPEGEIRFFEPKDCVGDQVVYWGKAYSVAPLLGAADRKIKVDVRLGGAPVVAEMDTGASTSMVTLAAAARAGVTPTSEGVAQASRIRGLGPQAVEAYSGVFPSFSFGDETIRNAKLRIADLFAADKERPINSLIPRSVIDEPNMLLGADFFRSHRVYVSRAQHKVYVSYMGGPVFQTRGVHPAPPPEAPAEAPPAK